MEHSRRSNCDKESIEKYDIKLKSKPKDGVILQLHHTIRSSKGESRRIRFSAGVFDDAHDKLACTDNIGNIFILDFYELKFWKLNSTGPCTALHFVPDRQDLLLVATAKNYEIVFVDTDTGNISFTLSGHTASVKHVSFCSKIPNFLTASSVEAILWELNNFTKYFTLNTYLGAQIQQIMFTPGGEYLVACFQNDTIQIWKQDTMKSVKQIITSELSHMKSIAFTMNGRAMAIGGSSPTLILFSMDTWKAIKSIDLTKFKISGVQQLRFIPQLFDGGSNKILAVLSNDCILHMINLETVVVVHSIIPESSGIRRFVVSHTGKYFLCILQLGEVNIYKTSCVMDIANDAKYEYEKKGQPCNSTSSHVFRVPSVSKAIVEQKMRICMDSARLRRILMQYGEYPEKHRSVIWKSLLDTPSNKIAYSALLDKGIHPSYKDIEKQFTIHSSLTLKNLKRLLSCLAHWSPLFAVLKFLPGFVFPFVKVLQKDPLLLFECVATVLLNYCQLWFEYAPFPPISVLAMTENLLAEHDPTLLEHLVEVGITSQTYALKILETAFSEVLTYSEWLILWDHIMSNEPAFILMAVVSYNIVQRNAIRKIKSHEELENFYHMQNPIDKKTFLKKAYLLLNDTPNDIHPRRFFKSFMSLEKGNCYQQFNGYPKATICLKLAKNERKKEHKNKNFTLKELTRNSQEKEINERSKLEDYRNRHFECDYKNVSQKKLGKDKPKSHDTTREYERQRGKEEIINHDTTREYERQRGKEEVINHNTTREYERQCGKEEAINHDNTREFERKLEKEELIKTLMYPTSICSRKSRDQYILETSKHKKDTCSTKSSIKRDKNEVLEKEVGKLIRSLTYSDVLE